MPNGATARWTCAVIAAILITRSGSAIRYAGTVVGFACTQCDWFTSGYRCVLFESKVRTINKARSGMTIA